MNLDIENHLPLIHAVTRLFVLFAVVYAYFTYYLKKKYSLKVPLKRFTVICSILLIPFPMMFLNNYVFMFFLLAFCSGLKETLVDVKYRLKLISCRGAFATWRLTSMLFASFIVSIVLTFSGDINPILGLGLIGYSLFWLVLDTVQSNIPNE